MRKRGWNEGGASHPRLPFFVAVFIFFMPYPPRPYRTRTRLPMAVTRGPGRPPFVLLELGIQLGVSLRIFLHDFFAITYAAWGVEVADVYKRRGNAQPVRIHRQAQRCHLPSTHRPALVHECARRFRKRPPSVTDDTQIGVSKYKMKMIPRPLPFSTGMKGMMLETRHCFKTWLYRGPPLPRNRRAPLR